MRYSIDTSTILDGWQRYYPPDFFPGLWSKLETLIQAGDLRAAEEVKYELKKKEDIVYSWAKGCDGLFVPIGNATQDAVSEVLAQHPRLIDTRRGRSGADPFGIAVAKVYRCKVVSGEHLSGSLNRPKIPDVCRDMGVEHLSLLELIRGEGWVFSL